MATTNTTYTISPSLSGYTGKIWPFTFSLDWDDVSINYDTSKVIWDFGDGTFSEAPTASHVYNFPGSYNVKVTVFDINGISYDSVDITSITVENIIDELILPYPQNKIVNIPAGRVSAVLRADRWNSWQSYPSLSASGYTFNFYASGSLSDKLDTDTLDTDKWSHIERTWRFVNKVVDNTGVVQYLPVDNLVTSNQEIYYKLQNGVPILCDESDEGSVFVGTSGSAEFYYIDDTPKNYNSLPPPVYLFISLDTTKFPDSYQILTPQINQATFYPELELFQHIRAVIPVKIRYNAATGIIFTSSGLTEMPLSYHKWQLNEIPYFINFVDDEGFIVDNYPPLTITTNVSSASALNVVSVSLFDENGTLSADFFDEFEDGLPPAISGTYRGYFIPYQTSDSATLCASVVVFNPPSIQQDTTIGWVAQPDTDTVFRISANVTSATFNTVGLDTTLDQQQTTFVTGENSILSIAVAPSASSDISVDSYVWMGDSDSDTLIKFSTQGELLSTLSLSALLGTTEKLSPSYISLDSNNNIWVALYDASMSIKIDASTYTLALSVVPTTQNIVYSASNVPNVFGGSNLIEPAILDVDTKNNVWVCYTNPLCCFAEKYNGTTGAILSTIPFPTGLTPSDILIDGQDNVWVIAGFTTSINPGAKTLVSPITAQKLPKQNNGFGQFSYTFNVPITSVLTPGFNYTFNINGLSDNYYNGTFLIESLSGNSIIVEPHPIAWEFASTKNISVSAFNPMLTNDSLSANFGFSDRILKIETTGTILSADGFYNPSYITIDTNENIWVSHHLTRITQVNSISANLMTNFTVGSAEYVLDTYQQRNYITAFPDSRLIRLLVNNPHDKVFQHIEGLTCDSSGILWVINDFEGRIYFIPTQNVTLSATTFSDFIDPQPGDYGLERKTYQAFGDWNGIRWVTKFPSVHTYQQLAGSTTFEILPASGLFHITKVNEDFDASSMYKSYRFTERLLNSTSLFDEFVGQMVGDVNADATTLGKLVYERIANFPSNNVDIDTCDITALYSLCNELNVPIDDYQFLLPANLKRICDLVSIKQKKLWGDRNKFNRDFDKKYSQNPNYGKNIGIEIDTTTYIVSAGTNLVFNQLFNNEFRLITTMVLQPLSESPIYTYPLSAYDPSWGWGLEDGVTGANISKYYNVYSYIPTYDNTQLEGVIDWQNPLNNLVETVSGNDIWTEDDGTVETMIDWVLRKGLGLFDN